MHTFFINTSGKKLENYEGFFTVQHETRQLVSLECPISKWENKDEGYEACAKKMAELIDSYKDMTNTFNLILYVDLLPYSEYTSIPMDDHERRYACLRALRTMIKHYIRATLVDRLDADGRVPQEILIIFEENKLPLDDDANTDDCDELTRSYVKTFLGFDDDASEVEALLNEIKEQERLPDVFCDRLEQVIKAKLVNETEKLFQKTIGKSILSTYLSYVEILLKEIEANKPIDASLEELYDLMISCKDDVVNIVSFETDRRADIENKQSRARRYLRLCFYLFSCIDEETIYEGKADKSGYGKKVKRFRDVNWKAVTKQLHIRSMVYNHKYNDLDKQGDVVTLKLAPKLYALDNERFGLDEFGNAKNTYVFKKVIDDQGENGEQNGVFEPQVRREIVLDETVPREKILGEYKSFDYTCEEAKTLSAEVDINDLKPQDDSDEDDSKKASKKKGKSDEESWLKKELDKKAISFTQLHSKYMNRLSVHVKGVLSGYAGRSPEHKPAILSKRAVSVDDTFLHKEKDYRYAKLNGSENDKTEKRDLYVVKEISDHAYDTTMLSYMSFCAGRSVGVTDIKKQSSWLGEKTEQIDTSINKIKQVAIGMLIAILILYIPFFLVQFEAILSNTMTMTIAIMSIAIPIVLLYVVFGFMIAKQKKRYYEVWEEFKKKSDEALKSNKDSAEKYDELLSIYIPSLRCVYEHKLDLDFYADCCRLAEAKLLHHAKKLEMLKGTIEDIIDKLEMDVDENEENIFGDLNIKLDYHLAFCSSENNRRFYSILSSDFLDAIYLKGGKK
ncbi:MAG: hypothetical protein J6D23_06135 [Clostridia bacterium]|nr:hypothetical protein [Clostridia bacterium]